MKISVIIPVKNGASTLEKCLSSLREQTIFNDLEIIILDSMSTDNSKEIALKYGGEIIAIPAGTFDHGLTRNIGVSHVTGELVYLTVQDAWIPARDMLEKMSNHFDDPQIMGVTGHQAVPHEKDKNPLVWYKRFSITAIQERQIKNIEEFKNLPQSEQQNLVAWDNVVAMYRTSALVKQPFAKTGFAEDWIWSYQALLKGWKLLRDPSLVVYHYHHQSYQYAFNTSFTVNYHFYKFFKYKPQLPALSIPMLKACYHLLKNRKLRFTEKLYWIKYNFFCLTGNFFSTREFLKRLKKEGEEGIEKSYDKYCKIIPQGQQK